MKENPIDRITDAVTERLKGTLGTLDTTFRESKPFNTQSFLGSQKLVAYDGLTEEEKASLIQKHGPEKWKMFEADVNRSRQARQGNG